MEQMMTLREVCDLTGASRRAIQGYEKAGLFSASGKTDRGYLLYDTETTERIRNIRLYQDMGFSIKEIVNIIDATDDIRNEAVEKQIIKLKKRKEQIERLINNETELRR